MAQIHPQRLVLDIHDSAILALSCESAVAAAMRGAPASHVGVGYAITLKVSPWRLAWTLHLCVLMAAEGLLRVVSLEDRASPGCRCDAVRQGAVTLRADAAKEQQQ